MKLGHDLLFTNKVLIIIFLFCNLMLFGVAQYLFAVIGFYANANCQNFCKCKLNLFAALMRCAIYQCHDLRQRKYIG